jgi:phosphate transport system substrate-binding protein
MRFPDTIIIQKTEIFTLSLLFGNRDTPGCRIDIQSSLKYNNAMDRKNKNLLILSLFLLAGCYPRERVKEIDINSKEAAAVEEKSLKISCPKSLYSLAAELISGYSQTSDIRTRLYPSQNERAFELLGAGKVEIMMTYMPLSELGNEPGSGDYSEILIARDAAAVIVNGNNPTQDVTITQLRDIYSGQIRTWEDLGWEDGGDIRICRTDEKTDSGIDKYFFEEMLGLKLRNRGDFIMAPSESDIPELVRKFKNWISYSTLGISADYSKILKISGASVNRSSMKNGSYPYLLSVRLLCRTSGPAREKAAGFLDYVKGSEASGIIDKKYLSFSDGK